MLKSLRWRISACLAFGLLVWSAAAKNAPAANGAPDLAGTWQLNRGQSEFPSEVAFGPQWQDTNPSGSDGQSSGRWQARGPAGAWRRQRWRYYAEPHRASGERRRRAENRATDGRSEKPPATLTISQTETSVTISDAQGVSRTFRTNDKEQVQQLKAGPMVTLSTWQSGKLVVDYRIEKDRRVRYTYARSAGQPQLRVDVQLLEKGKGAPIRRAYDAAV